MEGEKNCKITSVKERIDLLKKRKSREILERLTGYKAKTVRKDGIKKYLEFKTRGGIWYKSLTLCICNLDSNISLVAYFVSSVLLILFICCILSLLQNTSFRTPHENMFKQLIPAFHNKMFTYDTSLVKLKDSFFASSPVFGSIVIRQLKMNVRGLNPLGLI